jgi:hypothetical protein
LPYGRILLNVVAQPGWEAVYNTSKVKKNPTYEFKPIVSWATVEYFVSSDSPPVTIIVAMVVANSISHVLDFADLAGKFIGYNYPGCNADWARQARWGRPAQRKGTNIEGSNLSEP